MTKNNLRNKHVSKTICTSSNHVLNTCKVLKDQSKSVVGVAYTRYLLLEGAWKDEMTEGRNAEYYVSSLFFEKAGDKK